jgi:hypothetical protein
MVLLKNGVDKGGDGRTAGEDHQGAEKQERQDDGQQPKFFPHLEEAPQILDKIHDKTPCATQVAVALKLFNIIINYR